MKMPDETFKKIHDMLWRKADEVGWGTLSDQQKSSLYEEWLRSEEIGLVLSRYLDAGSIRVYIKDTIMKPYGRERLKDPKPIYTLLKLPNDVLVAREYIKPHGRMLRDGRVICWGMAKDWKGIIMAVFERARKARTGKAFAAVLMYPAGKTTQPGEQALVEEAGKLLGIKHVIWRDG